MRALISAFVLGWALLCLAPAFAQDEPDDAEVAGELEETPAQERATKFVGVTGPDAESVPGGALLIAAYAIVWILLFLFLLRMRGLQRQTAEELERLSAEIKATEGS
jgi:CcmD family protein